MTTARYLVLAAALAAAGCKSGGRSSTPQDVSPVENPVQVFVTNNYFTTVTISAAAGGATYRLGSVGPGMSQRFTLRPAMLASGGRVELTANADNQPRVTSGILQLSAGMAVDFTIGTTLANSIATIRP